MSTTLAPSPDTTRSADLADAPLRPDPQTERQLAILGELAEIGLDIARAIHTQVEAGDLPPASAAVAYGRVARAVRLTIALQTRLVAEAKAPAPDQARDTRRAQVKRVVRRVIAEGADDVMEAGWQTAAAYERLDHDDIYGDILARPVSELIALVCEDLGVSPDWASLAGEAWAKAEIATGAPGHPLAFDDDDDLDDPDDEDDPHAASP